MNILAPGLGSAVMPAGGAGRSSTEPVPLLSVRGLDKRFGGLHAVKAVDLDLAPGEIVGILGPNGAGKTTLYNLLTGFIPADAGEVRFEGRSIRGLAPHRIVSMGIARTFQLCRPFVGMSVLENVLVGSLGPRVPAGDREARARRLLALVGLGGKEAQPAELLSYGDQRRLEIARALATEPKLLLLDEPFAGLGSGEIDELSDVIRRLHAQQGLTILLIEHKLREFMKLVSRVVAIDFGEVIAQGTPKEIVDDPRVIEAYIGRQEPATEDVDA